MFHPDFVKRQMPKVKGHIALSLLFQGGVDSDKVPQLFIIKCYSITNRSSLETWMPTLRQINVQADIKHVNSYQSNLEVSHPK
jgi:hypothetical protein